MLMDTDDDCEAGAYGGEEAYLCCLVALLDSTSNPDYLSIHRISKVLCFLVYLFTFPVAYPLFIF